MPRPDLRFCTASPKRRIRFDLQLLPEQAGSWNGSVMPFSLQLLQVFLLHGTDHSPNENACVQESASHNRETLCFVSQTFGRIEAREYLNVFHKNSFHLSACGFLQAISLYLKTRANLGKKRKPPKHRVICPVSCPHEVS
jgi:hypothetical protein